MSEDPYAPSFCSRAYSFVKRHAYVPLTFVTALSLVYGALMCFHNPAAEKQAAESLLEQRLNEDARTRKNIVERIEHQRQKYTGQFLQQVAGDDTTTLQDKPKDIKSQ